MKINAKQIITAWATSFNPTTDEKKMASLRLEICKVCPSKKQILLKKEWASVCGECGCPISKKIYTKEYNACPLKKWAEIDDEFYEKYQKKSDSSYI